MSSRGEAAYGLTVTLPDRLLHELAEQVAALVHERLQPTEPASPWLDADGAMAYLGFSRDRLYKLTAAKAIPHRKKRAGQGLLFHRGELDRWVEAAYESTGCVANIELWSTATSEKPRRRDNVPGHGNGG